MIMANQKNCWFITSPDRNAFVYAGENVPIVILRKVAAPYATEALTASRPMRFSQPVKKPAFIPPSLQAHQYMPPEVGYAEASSAIQSPIIKMNAEINGQPMEIAIGPPLFQAWLNVV